MKLQNKIQKIKILILFCGLWTVVCGLCGCEAFVRKFTRKPKKEKLPKEELVIAPEEYKGPVMAKEDLYRQYFLFWKSWHDELITSLAPNTNHKKQIDCIAEAIKNLINLKALLNEEKQKKLNTYIDQLTNLKNSITKDIYGNMTVKNRLAAEHIKRNILRDFSYRKINPIR